MAQHPEKHPSVPNLVAVRIAKPAGRPYQIRYTCPIENREVRISVGSRSLDEAEQLKATVEAKLRLGLAVRSSAKNYGPDMGWESFREEYRSLHLIALREKSVQNAESRLDIAGKIVKPRTLGDMAESATLQRLQARLLAGEFSTRGRSRSPHTVRGYMKAVLASLNWAYLQDWLTLPPKIPRFKVSKRKVMKGRPITAEEFQKMLDATEGVVGMQASDSWKFILRGLWESALRIEEMMNVSWDKHDAIRPVWIEGQNPVLQIPAKMQKNDTDESIPLLPGFEHLLKSIYTGINRGWVFNPMSLQTKLGREAVCKRPNAEWVGKIIGRIGKAADIVVEPGNVELGIKPKYASAHDLRRSCGDRLRNARVPPLVICRVMRHSSWDTTRRHYAPGDVQADAQLLQNLLATVPPKVVDP